MSRINWIYYWGSFCTTHKHYNFIIKFNWKQINKRSLKRSKHNQALLIWETVVYALMILKHSKMIVVRCDYKYNFWYKFNFQCFPITIYLLSVIDHLNEWNKKSWKQAKTLWTSGWRELAQISLNFTIDDCSIWSWHFWRTT